MTESELLSVVLETAALFGWRTAHFRPAMTTHGWRTAVSGDGKGFPDLVLVRGHRLLAIELKSARGTVTADQAAWLEVLRPVASVHVWRPRVTGPTARSRPSSGRWRKCDGEPTTRQGGRGWPAPTNPRRRQCLAGGGRA